MDIQVSYKSAKNITKSLFQSIAKYKQFLDINFISIKSVKYAYPKSVLWCRKYR